MKELRKKKRNMIDSVVIKLEEDCFELLDKSFFDGQEYKKIDGRFSNNAIFLKEYREKQIKKGRYFPVIRLFKTSRGKNKQKEHKMMLEIQISLPKAKCGTNIFEIDEADLDCLCEIIVNYLKEIKINTDKKSIKYGILTRIDFSKVIVIPGYLGTSRQVIKELAGFNYKPSSDFRLNYYDDSFDSVSVKFSNKTQGYCIYGKLGEIETNGKTLFEQQVINQIKEKRLGDTTIKFELSLQRKQSMDAFLRRITGEKKKNFILANIFKEEIAKTALLETFDKVYSPLHKQLISLSLLEENKRDVLMRDKKIPFQKRAIVHCIINKAVKIGIKGVWEELRAEMASSTFDRQKKELSSIMSELGEIRAKPLILLDFLRQEHKKFKIIKPE